MSEKRKIPHRHLCLRCLEEFECQNPGECQAGYGVLPTIIRPDANRNAVLSAHCPDRPTWDWIREYGRRMAAGRTHDEAIERMLKQVYGYLERIYAESVPTGCEAGNSTVARLAREAMDLWHMDEVQAMRDNGGL